MRCCRNQERTTEKKLKSSLFLHPYHFSIIFWSNVPPRGTGGSPIKMQLEKIFSCKVDEKCPNSRGIFPQVLTGPEGGTVVLFSVEARFILGSRLQFLFGFPWHCHCTVSGKRWWRKAGVDENDGCVRITGFREDDVYLKSGPHRKQKTVVLVNDFGTAGIDGKYLPPTVSRQLSFRATIKKIVDEFASGPRPCL